jgi:hypothetical protein
VRWRGFSLQPFSRQLRTQKTDIPDAEWRLALEGARPSFELLLVSDLLPPESLEAYALLLGT